MISSFLEEFDFVLCRRVSKEKCYYGLCGTVFCTLYKSVNKRVFTPCVVEYSFVLCRRVGLCPAVESVHWGVSLHPGYESVHNNLIRLCIGWCLHPV